MSCNVFYKSIMEIRRILSRKPERYQRRSWFEQEPGKGLSDVGRGGIFAWLMLFVDRFLTVNFMCMSYSPTGTGGSHLLNGTCGNWCQLICSRFTIVTFLTSRFVFPSFLFKPSNEQSVMHKSKTIPDRKAPANLVLIRISDVSHF